MANAWRGEVDFTVDGETIGLVLTLGALARLEDDLGRDGLAGLAERLSAGGLSAGDALKVLAAGMAGAGHPRTVEELGKALPASDLGRARQAAAALLAAAFGGGTSPRPPLPQAAG
jgi:Phage tail tube protein, GTA-gp10